MMNLVCAKLDQDSIAPPTIRQAAGSSCVGKIACSRKEVAPMKLVHTAQIVRGYPELPCLFSLHLKALNLLCGEV
jgi:hypothetical protein